MKGVLGIEHSNHSVYNGLMPSTQLRSALLIVMLLPTAAMAGQTPLRLPPAKAITAEQVIAMTATGYYWQMGALGQTPPCSPLPVTAAPGQPASTRGMFSTNPTRGIFFAPVPSPGCR